MANYPPRTQGEAPAYSPEATTGETLVPPEEIADMGKRVLAAIADFIGANVAAFAVALVIGLVLAGVTGSFGAGGTLLVYAVGGLTVIAYFVASEAMYGQTPGKALVGVRVVRIDGSPVGWGGSVVRNILRIVDGLFFYLVGFLVAMTNDDRQRLGDMAADTVVVED